jgi:hypothetical protein
MFVMLFVCLLACLQGTEMCLLFVLIDMTVQYCSDSFQRIRHVKLYTLEIVPIVLEKVLNGLSCLVAYFNHT